jgi:hypothetical protein
LLFAINPSILHPGRCPKGEAALSLLVFSCMVGMEKKKNKWEEHEHEKELT